MPNKNNDDVADADIGLIEMVQFLIDNRSWIAVWTFVALLLGSLYVFFKPAAFEATASIQVAMVSGEAVETAAVLNEKIKLPLYFSTGTLQTCAGDGKPSPTESLAQNPQDTGVEKRPFFKFDGRHANTRFGPKLPHGDLDRHPNPASLFGCASFGQTTQLA